jgi:hypothetical protein
VKCAAILGKGPGYSLAQLCPLVQLLMMKFATALGDDGEHPRGQGIFVDMLHLEAFCLWGPG